MHKTFHSPLTVIECVLDKVFINESDHAILKWVKKLGFSERSMTGEITVLRAAELKLY